MENKETKKAVSTDEASVAESFEYFSFLNDEQQNNNGQLGQYHDRSLSNMESIDQEESREEYYRVSGDEDRVGDYEESLGPVARTIAADEGKGSFSKALDIYGRRAVNAYRELTGQQKIAVNKYRNKEDLVTQFIADGGVPVSVGIGVGVAGLAGVSSVPLLVGAGTVLIGNALIQAGGEKDEVENLDSVLEPAINFVGGLIRSEEEETKEKRDKTWEGFLPEKGEPSYGRKAFAIAVSDVVDSFVFGKVIKWGGKAIKSFFPQSWFKRNVKMLDIQIKEEQAAAATTLSSQGERKILKELVRDDKVLAAIRKDHELIETGKYIDGEVSNKVEIQAMAKRLGIKEKDFPPPLVGVDGDAKTIASHAGSRHHLRAAGKALEGAGKANTPEELIKNLEEYTTRRVTWEQTPRGQAGKTKVLDKEGMPLKEKMEDITFTPLEESLGTMKHSDVVHGIDEYIRISEINEAFIGKHTSESKQWVAEALRGLELSQTAVTTKGAIDLAYSKGIKKVMPEIKIINQEIQELGRRLSGMDGVARKRAEDTIRELKFKRRGIIVSIDNVKQNGKAMYALSLALRASVDTWLAKGAFIATATGNTINYGVAALSSIFKEQGMLTGTWDAVGHTIPNMLKSLGKRGLTLDGWANRWKEMSGGKGVYRTRTELDAQGNIKKVFNAASAINQQLLQEVDHFFQDSFKRLADREALRNMLLRRMREGHSMEQIKSELTKAVKKEEAMPLDYILEWRKTRANWADRLTFRAEQASDSPAIARPWWWIHDAANVGRNSSNPVIKFGGQALGVFSRVGANAADWAGRNTGLGLLDSPKMIGRKLRENLAEISIGTLGSFLLFSRTNMGNTLLGHHSILTDSRKKARTFGMNPGVTIDGEFVELKKLGGVGMALEITAVMEDILNQLMAEGETGLADKMGAIGHKVLNYIASDSWLTGSLLKVLSALDREEPGERGRLVETVLDVIPGKGVLERVEASVKGYRPDVYFLDAVMEMSDWLPQGPSRDGFGDVYTNTLVDRNNTDETGFPVAMGRIKLFLNPSEQEKPHYKVELNKFLLGVGAYSNSKTIDFKTSDGRVISLPTHGVNAKFKKTMRALNRKVNIQRSGTYRMTERDYHAAKALMSLKQDAVAHTIKVWEEAYGDVRVKYPESSLLSDSAIQMFKGYFKSGGPLIEVRSKFMGYVPSEMLRNKEKGLSNFLHYLAVTPIGQLEGSSKEKIKENAEIFRYFLSQAYEVERLGMTEKDLVKFSETLGRRELIIEMYDYVREHTSKVSAFAPSVVEQAAELRWYGESDDAEN